MSGSKSSKFNFNDALFYAEMYNREFLSRLHWFEKNYRKVYESQPGEAAPRKARLLYEELVRRRQDDHRLARPAPRPALPDIPRPDPGVQLLPPMRPVPAAERALLKEGSGAFLRARYRTSPDGRYHFPATSNWDYGWLTAHMPQTSTAIRVHGRKNIIKETFFRRSGLHPESSHYRQTTSHNLDFPFI